MNHIKNTQLMNLDFLRIVFTLIVIAYHFIRNLGIWNEGGGYVVEFFFVLSGFLIVYRFNSDMSDLTFLKKKIVRFVPIYDDCNKSTQLIQTQKREINV